MARRRAIPAGRGIVQQLALVIAIAVHVVYFGSFSSSPSALFLAAAPAPNAAKVVMKAITPQDDGAHAETAGLHTAPNYLSFLMNTRDMYFREDSHPFKGKGLLAHETGTHIRLEKNHWFTYDGRWKRIVTIAGESSHVIAAFAKMLQPSRSENVYITVLVPEGAVANFIGSGGSKISAMRKETGALIRMTDSTSSRWRMLKIRGTNAEVNAAVSCILGEQDDDYIKETRSLLDCESPGTYVMRSQTEMFFKLSDEKSRYIMGQGGKTARMITRSFGVSLLCDFDSSTWTLSGNVGNVHAAHHYISAIVFVDGEEEEE